MPLISGDFPGFNFLIARSISSSLIGSIFNFPNPASYRGVTVAKIFTQIIQSILKSRVDIQIDQIQNPLQRGLTEAIPMLFAAFIASEVIIESIIHCIFVVLG
jgi:hypothetical protein